MSAKKKATAKSAKKSTKKTATKKVVRKTSTRKVATKKSVARKAAKKTVAKVAKKSTKKTTRKVARKTTGKATGPKEKKSRQQAQEAPPVAKKGAKRGRKSASEKANKAIKEEVSRRVSEAVRKRIGKKDKDNSSKSAPVAFTLNDVRSFLKSRSKDNAKEKKAKPVKKAVTAKEPAAPKKTADVDLPARSKQNFGAVSVADLLGFDPTAQNVDSASKTSEKDIPEKWLPYYRMLVQLHEEVGDGLHRHSEETLRRSSKEDTGDLSSYGQHMADAGTDSFERDFALSMVSSEQEALYEIDEAIRRIRNGTYGICEITGKPISRQRLKAVPFARYSLEGQMDVEKGRRKVVQRPGIVGIGSDDALLMSDDDPDE